MLQVKTFLLPSEEVEANEWLASHKTETVNFNTDMIVCFFDDGEYPDAHKISDLKELVASNKKQRYQMEVALHLMERDLADLNAKHNKGRWEELSNAIHETKKQMEQHDAKREYTETRIAELTV